MRVSVVVREYCIFFRFFFFIRLPSPGKLCKKKKKVYISLCVPGCLHMSLSLSLILDRKPLGSLSGHTWKCPSFCQSVCLFVCLFAPVNRIDCVSYPSESISFAFIMFARAERLEERKTFNSQVNQVILVSALISSPRRISFYSLITLIHLSFCTFVRLSSGRDWFLLSHSPHLDAQQEFHLLSLLSLSLSPSEKNGRLTDWMDWWGWNVCVCRDSMMRVRKRII